MNMTGKLVDADSQFTRPARLPDGLWQIKYPASDLLDKRCVFFCHSVFGGHHNMFPIWLRKLLSDNLDEVIRAVREFAFKEWKNTAPDVLLYPSESTAAYLVKPLAKEFGKQKPVPIMLGPAFRRWNTVVLRPELTNEAAPVFKRDRLKVLFFDDSISSGSTETNAIDALLDTFSRARAVDWLTYAIIARKPHLPQKPIRYRANTMKVLHRIRSYSFAAYAEMGPESLNSSVCPLCAARSRLEAAVGWSIGARVEIRSILQRADSIVAPVSLQRVNESLSLIPPDAEKALLYLSSLDLPDASIVINRLELIEDRQVFGALLFAAFNFSDLSAYAHPESLVALASRAATLVSRDDQKEAEMLLVAIAALPVSIASRLIETVTSGFVLRNCLNLNGAFFALLITGQARALAQLEGENDASARLVTERAVEFRDGLFALLEKIEGGAGTEQKSAVAVAINDLHTLGEPPQAEGDLWQIRILAALLHEGKHRSFLLNDLENVDGQTAQYVRLNLLHTLGLIRAFLSNVAPGTERTADDAVKRVNNAVTPADLNTVGLAILDELWFDNIGKEYLYDSAKLDQRIEYSIIEAKKRLRKHGLERTGWVQAIPTVCAESHWEMYGPVWPYLEEHFLNLLINPIKHYQKESPPDLADCVRIVQRAESEPIAVPIVVIFSFADPKARTFNLVFADRAEQPDETKLLSWYSGLSSCRALLQTRGGELLYFARGDLGRYPLLEERVRNIPVLCEQHINFFITQLPIVLAYKINRGSSDDNFNLE
jgi:hypothetical protein